MWSIKGGKEDLNQLPVFDCSIFSQAFFNFSMTAKSFLTQKGMVMLKIWATMLLNHHWTGDVPWSGWHETMFLEVERLCSGLRGVNCYNLRVVQTPGNSLTPINVGTTLGFKRDRGALHLVMRFPAKLLWTFCLEEMQPFWPRVTFSISSSSNFGGIGE